MPSSHKYMQVRFAKRRSNGESVVVKVRTKPKCFRGRDDEREWRSITEFLLNMPEDAGVVKLFEVLEDSSALYVIMERVHGQDLFESISGEGAVAPELARQITFQLLEATAHLHGQGLVHKDLKLENVVVDEVASPKLFSPKSARKEPMSPTSPSVKLIDFDTVMEWTPSSPKTKDVLGTDQYIAPEAYDGMYSPLSDVFALGVIAYKLLAGGFPFPQGMFDDEPGENWVGSPKMKQIRRRLKGYEVKMDRPVFINNPHAKDLVSKMLAVEENERFTAEHALAHEWFAGIERRNRSLGPNVGARPLPEALPLPVSGQTLGGNRPAEQQRPSEGRQRPSEGRGSTSMDIRNLREISSREAPRSSGSSLAMSPKSTASPASPSSTKKRISASSALLGAGAAVARFAGIRTGSTTRGDLTASTSASSSRSPTAR
jgi:serine/threonine protein kinase